MVIATHFGTALGCLLQPSARVLVSWRRVDLLYIATLAYNFNPHQRVSNESPTNLNSVANIPFMPGRVVEPSDEDNGDNSSSLLRTNMHLWHLLAQFNRVLMRTPPSQQFHACAQTRVSSSYSRAHHAHRAHHRAWGWTRYYRSPPPESISTLFRRLLRSRTIHITAKSLGEKS